MTTLKQKIEALGEQDYMSDGQLAIFKEALIFEKSRLIESSKNTRNEVEEESGHTFSDPVDKSQRVIDASIRSAQEFVRSKRIKQINAALDAIRAGDFGYCEECGGEIGIARLCINPCASMDVSCQEMSETSTKQLLGTH
ncbi:MAG: hypothetical protein CBC55_04700 [Gammaproteobacteria bacterium TMED95]|uniref:DksA C4-type domain-containing protein n=1 Tax=Alteromonas mediterranea TaxID=314275 RepID=A0AAC9JE11_9ALTE|nr:TraR/DksA family transcriptional regulator [Alteromonas mediterranea]APD92309.1 hypothetical protein BM524_20600 [Alteromonas mediterranea]APE00170.1 hypothetical protein BM525_20825 [Alteromonas mediterranea]OUV22098.1 MAG: hypothetical protein CBC55_04700 [Gammaproteobacteria bacterium TMED95]|tara:strand:- start:3974 stop:4393 length:420 start_codon:yes stop_codon:yes gene_type:complete